MSNLPSVNVKDFADYLVKRYQVEGECITPAKLQKLLYYIQAWHLVHTNGHPLFVDEPEAWVNGPVYSAVYSRYSKVPMYECIYESEQKEPITSPENEALMTKAFERLKLNAEQVDIVESVIQAYGFMDTQKLITLTHSERPWADARQGLSPIERSAKPISHDVMKHYYEQRLNRKK